MNNSIPTTIRIGKSAYRLEFPDRMPNPLVRGNINYGTRTISIAYRAGVPLRRRSDSGRMKTYWHEVVHGILYDMGSRKFRDEIFVDGIATRIAQVTNSARFEKRGW